MMSRRAHQRGAIFLALVLVMFVTGSTMLLGALNNRQTAWLSQQTELHRQMEIAKANLLSYLANSNAFFADSATVQGPGFFPCPDTDNDAEGLPNSPCDPTSTTLPTCYTNTLRPAPSVGRLPRYVESGSHRMEISDYYEDSNLQFWYVVSPRYVYHSTSLTSRRSRLRTSTSTSISIPAPPCMRLYLNDNPGYVAFIIAPGEELSTQNRLGNPTLYTNYLDGQNGATNYYYYTRYESNPELFNDQIIGITLAEYVIAIGMRVALESKQEIDTYHVTNGFYPTTSTNFRNELNDIIAPTDHVWLLPSASTGYNGERWSTDTSYTWLTNDSARINFSGCTGITFTLTYPDGIDVDGDSC